MLGPLDQKTMHGLDLDVGKCALDSKCCTSWYYLPEVYNELLLLEIKSCVRVVVHVLATDTVCVPQVEVSRRRHSLPALHSLCPSGSDGTHQLALVRGQ